MRGMSLLFHPIVNCLSGYPYRTTEFNFGEIASSQHPANRSGRDIKLTSGFINAPEKHIAHPSTRE